MLVLGIETSCDDTSVALLEDGRRILANRTASQVDLHALTGGVVPEVAARHHVEQIIALVEYVVRECALRLHQIDLIAVTNRPGLVGSLMVGVSTAKALGWMIQRPVIPVHHLMGHMAAARLADPSLEYPYICLVVSGGHTELHHVLSPIHGHVLGRTRDDAAGEAFDKAARMLGLGYPGGPLIDRAARDGRANAFALPRAWLEEGSLDFSFSGVKTALWRRLQSGEPVTVADAAAVFQEAIVDVLSVRLLDASARTGVARVAICGGVAANSALKARIQEMATARGVHAVAPPLSLCTDNAAMIAAAGWEQYQAGAVGSLSFDVIASEALSWSG